MVSRSLLGLSLRPPARSSTSNNNKVELTRSIHSQGTPLSSSDGGCVRQAVPSVSTAPAPNLTFAISPVLGKVCFEDSSNCTDLSGLHASGIFVTDGEKWTIQRKATSKIFNG